MNQEPIPSPENPLSSRARRRRARRTLIPASDDARAAFLEGLARRAYPSVEFFLFSLLGGAVMGAGYLVNSPSLLVAGALLAPLMTPWVGLCLATVSGSLRYFLQTLGSLLVGGVLILATSLTAGFAARIWMPLPLSQLYQHARLWWPDLIIVAVGAILLVISFARSENRPILPSVMLAYEFYLPLSAAGFALASGEPGIWPQGLEVLAVHLALATLLGLVMLFILRFRPLNAVGYGLGGVIFAVAIIALITLTGLGSLVVNGIGAGAPAITPTGQTQPFITPPPLPTTARTPTPQPSPTTSPEPSLTPTPTATPIYASINAQGFDSAIVRSSAGFDSSIVTGLPNGSLVVLLPETKTVNGTVWLHILIPQSNQEGWVLQSVLALVTPAPNP